MVVMRLYMRHRCNTSGRAHSATISSYPIPEQSTSAERSDTAHSGAVPPDEPPDVAAAAPPVALRVAPTAADVHGRGCIDALAPAEALEWDCYRNSCIVGCW